VKSNIHVDAELLAAWSEGSLPKDEAAQVESHLADCSSCQEMLAVFARTEPPAMVPVPQVPAPVVSGFRRTWWQWRWAIPIAAAATVAAIWVAIPEDERTAQLNPTVSPSVSERAAQPPATAADAAAPALEKKPEQKPVAPRRDASGLSENRAEKTAPAGKVDSFGPAPKEQDQDLKAEAAQAPASAAAAATPPAAQGQAASQASPTQRRLEVEARSGLQRQAAEVISPDPLVRWRIVPTNRLERSTNGGKTWDVVTLPPSITPTGITAPSANTAVVTASDGRQFSTDDQGKTWNLVQP